MEGGYHLKGYLGVTTFTNDPKSPLIEDSFILVDDGQILEIGEVERASLPEGAEIREFPNCVAFPQLTNSYVDLSAPLECWMGVSFRSHPTLETYKNVILEGRKYWKDRDDEVVDILKKAVEDCLSLGIGKASFALPWLDDARVFTVPDRVEMFPIPITVGPVVMSEEVEEEMLKAVVEAGQILFVVLDETFYKKHGLFAQYEPHGIFRYVIVDFSFLENAFMKAEGRKGVEVFSEAGVFTKNSVIVHGWGLTDIELDVLAVKNVPVVKTPRFELLVHGGTLSLNEYVGRGMQVNLGTGPFRPNLFKEIEVALLFHQASLRSAPPMRILLELLAKLVFSEGGAIHMGNIPSKRLMRGFDASFVVAKSNRKIKTLEDFALFLMEEFDEQALQLVLSEGKELLMRSDVNHS